MTTTQALEQAQESLRNLEDAARAAGIRLPVDVEVRIRRYSDIIAVVYKRVDINNAPISYFTIDIVSGIVDAEEQAFTNIRARYSNFDDIVLHVRREAGRG